MFDDSKNNNLDLSKEKILSMIHFKHTDIDNLDEYIENRIEKVIKVIGIKEIASFQQDSRIKFKKIKYHQEGLA